MAGCIDTFSDFAELGITDDEDKLTRDFNKAAKHVQAIASAVDNKTLLRLYGYYKQATVGPCNTAKPGWFDFDVKAKSKWDAWKSLGSMSQADAKAQYVATVLEVDSKFREELKCDRPAQEGWVTVSTLQHEEPLEGFEKQLVDYVNEGNAAKVDELLGSPKVKNAINELDGEGLGLIHWAADRGSLSVLEVLLSHGADVNATDAGGQTALHYAASCGHTDCVEFLLRRGVRVDLMDENGLDALRLAGSDEVVKRLIMEYL